MKKKPKKHNPLNDQYREGRDIKEDFESGRDTLSEMSLAESRPDILANQLREMGIGENGDEPEDAN